MSVVARCRAVDTRRSSRDRRWGRRWRGRRRRRSGRRVRDARGDPRLTREARRQQHLVLGLAVERPAGLGAASGAGAGTGSGARGGRSRASRRATASAPASPPSTAGSARSAAACTTCTSARDQPDGLLASSNRSRLRICRFRPPPVPSRSSVAPRWRGAPPRQHSFPPREPDLSGSHDGAAAVRAESWPRTASARARPSGPMGRYGSGSGRRPADGPDREAGDEAMTTKRRAVAGALLGAPACAARRRTGRNGRRLRRGDPRALQLGAGGGGRGCSRPGARCSPCRPGRGGAGGAGRVAGPRRPPGREPFLPWRRWPTGTPGARATVGTNWRLGRGLALPTAVLAVPDHGPAQRGRPRRHRRRLAAKYRYNRPRPAEADPGLSTALPTPASPAYPCSMPRRRCRVLGARLPVPGRRRRPGRAGGAGRARLVAGVAYPSDVAAGLDLGRAVGERVVAWARSDGSDAVWTGAVPEGPGLWQGANPAEPLAGTWRTRGRPAGGGRAAPPAPAGAGLGPARRRAGRGPGRRPRRRGRPGPQLLGGRDQYNRVACSVTDSV